MADEVAIRQMRSLLTAQMKLREAAEEMARQARGELERVAEALCPAEVNEIRYRGPAGLREVGIGELADLVITTVQRRMRAVESIGGSNGEGVVKALEGKVRALESEVSRLRRELEEARRGGEGNKKKEDAPAAQPAVQPSARLSDRPEWRRLRVAVPPSRPVVPPSTWPGWAQEWKRGEGTKFSRARDVIIVAGRGAILQQDVDAVLAEWWGVTPGSGGIRRTLARQERAGLIEVLKPERLPEYRPRYLIRLTEHGRDVYRLLTGEDAGECRVTELLRRHKSVEHAALNVDAAEMLFRAGYDVDLFPDVVRVEGGEYRPDLVAVVGGERLYVECERTTPKSDRKWQLYHQATGGRFYIVTISASAAEALRGHLRAWAQREGMEVVLRIADMERSRKALEEGDTIWLIEE